ncbi:MAG: hypothetical protein WBJ33_01275, partial [Candidatus Nanopelagicales bacterium]
AMKAKQSQAAALFAAPLSKTARTLAALQGKLESDPGAAAAEPVASAPVADEAAPTEGEPMAEVQAAVETEELAAVVEAEETDVTEETTEG